MNYKIDGGFLTLVINHGVRVSEIKCRIKKMHVNEGIPKTKREVTFHDQ